MRVKDIMSTDIVTCDVGATLQTAVERMLTNDVGSVIVTRDGDPFGILTQTDALHAGAVTERPFPEIPVERVASHPLVTATKSETVRSAIDRMQTKRVKRLPVVEGLEVVGILTQSDINAHFHSFIREAHALEQRQESWSSEDRFEE
ncbi:CBS domain-containing protein [Halorientalis salina]|uniref:CBS domain-containing protein n=1 Tax=Halorientalis salina TaxID=2932266 RepID=UPI0010AD946C|nr:CBS domain-containing protein [Halorientalis salina]